MADTAREWLRNQGWSDESMDTDAGSELVEHLSAYSSHSNAELVKRVAELEKVAFLIGSIYFYGKFKAETCNERELEALLRELGYFFESEPEVLAKRQLLEGKDTQ